MSSNPTPYSDVTIRPVRLNDGDSIYGFLCELEDELLDSALFQSIFERNLQNPLIFYLVAEVAGQAVGFVSCHVQYLLHHVGKVGEIQELFVKTAYRNQQIGHKLINAIDMLAAQEGFVNLEVTTNQKRTATVRFYEREAFHCTHFKLVKSIQS